MRLDSRLIATAAAIAALTTVVPWAASRVSAQRPPPADAARAFALYGRRYVVPVPSGGAGATAALRTSNVGWNPTTLAWVAIGTPPSTQCPVGLEPSQIIGVGCGAPLSPHEYQEMPAVLSGATHLMVYSLAAATGTQACVELTRVALGDLSLNDWERAAFTPGEPIVTSLSLRAGNGAVTVVSGQPVAADLLGDSGRVFPRALSAPVVEAGTVVRTIALGAECAMLQGSWGPLHESTDCPTTRPLTVAVPPMSAADLPASSSKGAYSFTTNRPTVGLASHMGPDGWYSLPLSIAGAETRQSYFPLAAGLVEGLTSELWVANQHMTATTTIDIFMLDGVGGLHKLITDPVPLCARATRVYDITALAGTLPPGRRGPSMLTLHVTSTNLTLPVAPAIGAGLILRSGGDAAAYAGFDGSSPLLNFTGGRDRTFPGTPVVAVEGVHRNVGQPASTTVMAVQSVRTGGNNTQVFVDFYDQSGTLVVHDAYFAAQGDGAAVIHLGRPMMPVGGGDPMELPDGFVGTALIRPQQPRETLGVLSFDLPAGVPRVATAAGAVELAIDGNAAAWIESAPLQARVPLAMHQGIPLIHPLDPSIPTATATEVQPTATPTGLATTPPTSWALYLPKALTH